MSLQVFGAELRFNNPSFHRWTHHSMDVGDIYTAPANGATVTITGITNAALGAKTSIAYTVSGSFTAGPQILSVFQGWLTKGTLIRTSYRGAAIATPQWYISEYDRAGISPGEYTLLE